jgi:predicted nucleic acid-binding protein
VRLVHTKQVNEHDGRLQVARLPKLPIRIVERDPLYPRAFDIARSLGWSKAYDALYLAVADSEAAELLTVDGGMLDAARRLGIRVSLVN